MLTDHRRITAPIRACVAGIEFFWSNRHCPGVVWAHVAGMARRTFMRAFSAQAGISFGRWRQQARLFAALEILAQNKSVTEVAIAVGYDSVSAFIEMFRTMLGTTPQTYFRGRQEPGHEQNRKFRAGEPKYGSLGGAWTEHCMQAMRIFVFTRSATIPA